MGQLHEIQTDVDLIRISIRLICWWSSSFSVYLSLLTVYASCQQWFFMWVRSLLKWPCSFAYPRCAWIFIIVFTHFNWLLFRWSVYWKFRRTYWRSSVRALWLSARRRSWWSQRMTVMLRRKVGCYTARQGTCYRV